jgi:hypothetical protein
MSGWRSGRSKECIQGGAQFHVFSLATENLENAATADAVSADTGGNILIYCVFYDCGCPIYNAIRIGARVATGVSSLAALHGGLS